MFEWELASIGITAAATLWIAFVLTRNREAGVMGLAPAVACPALLDDLRLRGFMVKGLTLGAKVRLGSIEGVALHAEPTSQGTTWSWRTDATPTGNGILFTLVFLGLLGIAPEVMLVAALLAFYLRRRARRFATTTLPEAMKAAEKFVQVGAQPDVRRSLLLSLAECRRLAQEAFEAQRSRYWDHQAYAALGATLVAVFLFLWLLTSRPGVGFDEAVASALWPAIAAGLAVYAPCWTLLRRSHIPGIAQTAAWGAKLEAAFRREAEGQPPAPGESPVELILEATKEIPGWRAASAKSGLLADARLGMPGPLWGSGAVLVGSVGLLVALFSSALFGGAIVAAAIPLAAASFMAERKLKQWKASAAAAAQEEWGRLEAALHARLEWFSGGG